ncbi:MAG: hypothetical protein FNP40_15385 [Dehalobacter sp. 4CP]|uniref:DUF5301 domain-containing protein n=1 Tax=Dehalobacter sp. CP TaxID=2594474 RepID=UPI0013CC7334|nr:DUF5301 domain-containing protein [Dehalobacter sp.]NBJ16907.1 hypothetical protein [Dehalobacter sp. 4CP]
MKERFANCINANKRRRCLGVFGVFLAAVCLIGGLTACNQASPAMESGQDKTLDVYTNSVTGGSLVFPESWQGKYVTAPIHEYDDRTFIQVYSKSNHDKYKEYRPDFGFLFSILQIPEDELRGYGWDGGEWGTNMIPFAQKKVDGKDWIYFVRTPTDRQYDPGDDTLKNDYLQLQSEIPLLLQSFCQRGQLEAYATDIKLLKYRNAEVKNTVAIPQSNKELVERISTLLTDASPTKMQSINVVPDAKSYVKVILSPQNIYYLYEKGGKYYAEKPYVAISELKAKAYQEILLSAFGVIPADPDTLDKQQLLKPVQEMIALYEQGTPPENGSELKFEQYQLETFDPVVKTSKDFELDEGAPPEYEYTATVRFGVQKQNEMIMQLNRISDTSASGGAAQWKIIGVSFQVPVAKKDSAWLFDLAIANRFDYVPEFEEGKAPAESPDYLYYAFILFDINEWKAGHNYLTKQYVEDVITSHFPVKKVIHQSSDRDWNFDGKVYTVKPGSYRLEPIYGLQQVRSFKQNGKTIYDVVVEQYGFDEFAYVSIYDYQLLAPDDKQTLTKPMQYVLEKKGEKIKSGKLKVWQAIREMINEGDTAKLNKVSTERFKFYLNEKTNEIVFLEHDVRAY